MVTKTATPKNLPAFVPIVRALMKQNNITSEAELARAVKIPQPSINRVLSGQVTDPHISTLNTLAQYFKVTIDQLLGNAPLHSPHVNNPSITTLPIISWSEAINSKQVLKKITPQSWKHWTTINLKLSQQSYALKSKPSMAPRFPTNSILIVDTECKPRDGDLVIVHYDGTDNATIREIMIDGRTKELRSILSNNTTESVTSEHHILGVLIQTRFSYRQ